MTPEMKTAAIRGAYSAAVSFGGTFFSTLMLGLSFQDALVAGGFAAFVALGWRGGEGIKDSRSATR